MEPPELTILVPAHDEEENIHPLLEELDSVLSGAGLEWEVIVIDDGSGDKTLQRLREATVRHPGLRVLSFSDRRGKSAALAAGIAAARGVIIGMMDADLQNCPADFLTMIRAMRQDPTVALIQGHRIRRQDSWAKRQASRLGFLTRRILLGDQVRDTGCAIRLLSSGCAADLPLHFEGLHRFIPFLVKMNGGKVQQIPVDHRPRRSGQSKYHLGFVSRGLCGFLDLLAVRWMAWRHRATAEEAVSTPGKNA